jgi:GTP-sensing pleiotropic transcriptional regulator CodY
VEIDASLMDRIRRVSSLLDKNRNDKGIAIEFRNVVEHLMSLYEGSKARKTLIGEDERSKALRHRFHLTRRTTTGFPPRLILENDVS